MRALLSVALLLLSFTAAQLKADYNPLLKKYADSLRYHRDAQVRLVYNDSFTRLIRDMADEDNGFAEPLDSIMSTISVLKSDDGKLKVISWLVINEKEEFFNHCLVLYKAKENRPHKSFWLRDKIEPKSD